MHQLYLESNRRPEKKQFRGNSNYQHFLELEERRKARNLEAQRQLVITTTPPAPTIAETTTIAPPLVLAEHENSQQKFDNRTEVIRRRKASYHKEIDNDLQQENELPFPRFLSLSVRKYLALGRAIPGEIVRQIVE